MVVWGCMVVGGMHGCGGHACVVVGGHAWWLGDICGCRGHVWLQVACVVAGGHAWLGGACMGYEKVRSMSGWYASYWKAFLLKHGLISNPLDLQ